MGRSLVIVESPAKARTIGKYLGGGFRVEASIGHVRDLPRKASEIPPSKKKEPWARLGVDVEHGFRPLYIVPPEKRAQVNKLKEALAEADELYLATDEDREGESISWHLVEVLKPKVPVRRMVFHEITAEAIREAIAQPRSLDLDLVRAQETRRVVDRLYGYTVSPLLWKKIRQGLSAGRVQSVAVRLVVERERRRMAFRSAEWWDVLGTFEGARGRFQAELIEWEGSRVASGRDFDEQGKLKNGRDVVVFDQATAKAVAERLDGMTATIEAVDEKPHADRPAPPFTTSTLQQEANRKLGWTARRTMQTAQRLYENGWITYMRTDSTTLSDEALAAARALIRDQYGEDYLPPRPRVYKSKVKNAQEAHEAIRPAGRSFRSLHEAHQSIGGDEARLYELIWKRTVASQMADATGKLVQVRVRAGGGRFQARGKTIEFPGFRRAYVEGSDTPEDDLAEQERVLPQVALGEPVAVVKVVPRAHQTSPPPRLTEATLVKELEHRGIGRPSTYATIIETILAREYVFKKKNALVPTFIAFAVTGLLERHLAWLVDYEFTARMESELDEIALGRQRSEKALERFFLGEQGLRAQLERADEKIDPREVCTIPLGEGPDGVEVVVRVGRHGAYLSWDEARVDLPEDLPPDELTVDRAQELLQKRKEGPRLLGTDPESGERVYLMKGRFGPYLQLGGVEQDGKGRKVKPPRASLVKGMSPDDVDLETARFLLSLPRELGTDPESGEVVTIANGRYGPYVRRGKDTRSLPDPMKLFIITLDEALALLKAPKRQRRTPQPLKELGTDCASGKAIKLMDGRYGPYVTDGETNATLPRGTLPDQVDLGTAIALIRDKAARPKRPRRRARRTQK